MTTRYDSPEEAVKNVQAWRIQQGELPQTESAALAREALVGVQIAGVGNYMMLCTPFELEALAVGFAYSEGLLSGPDDVASVTMEPTGFWSAAVRLELRSAPEPAVPRNLIVTSSCGLCGSQVEKGLEGPAVGSRMRVAGPQLIRVADSMWGQQTLFRRTGGTHAAGLFDQNGDLLSFAEDSGRHNALDKAIGKCLLAGGKTDGCGTVISGRISYELIIKSARAGLEVVAGVSAPSALAAQAAEQRNITLCGFLRSDRLTVYSHPYRFTDLPEFKP
jgi:FdhD protein